MMPWDSFLTEHDRAVIAHGRFGRRMGFGARPDVDYLVERQIDMEGTS